MAEVKKGIVQKASTRAMTSKLLWRSMLQDCETRHSDSEECKAVCLTSAFGILCGLGNFKGAWRVGNSSVEGFLIGIASTCPPIAQTDFYMERGECKGQNLKIWSGRHC